jgi:hypothetical protein
MVVDPLVPSHVLATKEGVHNSWHLHYFFWCFMWIASLLVQNKYIHFKSLCPDVNKLCSSAQTLFTILALLWQVWMMCMKTWSTYAQVLGITWSWKLCSCDSIEVDKVGSMHDLAWGPWLPILHVNSFLSFNVLILHIPWEEVSQLPQHAYSVIWRNCGLLGMGYS